MIAIVIARNAPSHERAVKTLRVADVHPDKMFFLGGIGKAPILKVLKPHIFFDDQITNCCRSS